MRLGARILAQVSPASPAEPSTRGSRSECDVAEAIPPRTLASSSRARRQCGSHAERGQCRCAADVTTVVRRAARRLSCVNSRCLSAMARHLGTAHLINGVSLQMKVHDSGVLDPLSWFSLCAPSNHPSQNWSLFYVFLSVTPSTVVSGPKNAGSLLAMLIK